MIDVITVDEVRRLAEIEGGHCISVYLPTHPSGSDTVQDPVRLKNLVGQAARSLEELGMRRADVAERIAAATELTDDHEFWQHAGHGLAVFVDGESLRLYRLGHVVDELVVVAERLHLKPLLPSISSGEVFYVLALSQNHVRLLRGSRFGLDELALGDIPDSLATALRFDDREPALASYAATRTGRGTVAASFHGQGIGKDTHDADLDRFLLAVDAGVRHVIGDGAPVVLAGVDHITARYRKLSHVPTIVGDEVRGNPDRLRASQLHENAWPLVHPIFTTDEQAARQRYLAGAAPNVATVSNAILPARDGRIATLHVPLGVQRWGRFEPELRRVEEHADHQPGDRDLLDVIAIDTLVAGGQVFVVDPSDVPGDGVLAGTLRY